MIRILVAEDDETLNYAVCKHLDHNGYAVKGVSDAREALAALYAERYDLIISDIMMPHMDGFALAREVRAQDKHIPVLFLTARDDFLSKEKGYRLGIDDYLTKPVDLDELLLHIMALLRRANISARKRLEAGNLVLDEDALTASVNGQDAGLTLREFQIAFKLLSYPGKTFTRGQLIDDFAGLESESGLRSVDVHITNLRQKLAACNGFDICTVRGLGYKAVLR